MRQLRAIFGLQGLDFTSPTDLVLAFLWPELVYVHLEHELRSSNPKRSIGHDTRLAHRPCRFVVESMTLDSLDSRLDSSMQYLLDGGLVCAVAINLWPSEALQVSRAAPACQPFWATSQALLASPSQRPKLLQLVAEGAGAASGEAVLLAGPKARWPRWHDGLEVLRSCGLKVHEETRAMQHLGRSCEALDGSGSP